MNAQARGFVQLTGEGPESHDKRHPTAVRCRALQPIRTRSLQAREVRIPRFGKCTNDLVLHKWWDLRLTVTYLLGIPYIRLRQHRSTAAAATTTESPLRVSKSLRYSIFISKPNSTPT